MINIISDGARFGNRWPGVVSGSFMVYVLADGAGTAFLDARSLFRQGLNIGPTMQNTGTGAITISGTLAPANIATNPRTRANPAHVLWEALAGSPLASGGTLSTSPKVYTAFKIDFAGAGQLNIATL